MASPPRRYVPAARLRRLFNELRFVEAVEAGRLTIQLKTDKHPSAPGAGEPFCTRSQAVGYFDANGRQVAVVHQYLRQDGSLGASGRPDPKWLLHDGEVLMPENPSRFTT